MICKRPLAVTIAFLTAQALCAPVALAWGEMIIYRCVDPSGAVSLQNDVPCPKGSQQTIRKVGEIPVIPPPKGVETRDAANPAKRPGHGTAKPEPPPPLPTPDEPPPPALVRMAPPPLFQCRTWDEREYFGDTDTPPGTCVPVESIGIGGSRELAAGTTCEMRYDACLEVPAALLCQSWKKRVDEAEFRWKFGNSTLSDPKAEYERIAKRYRESTCISD